MFVYPFQAVYAFVIVIKYPKYKNLKHKKKKPYGFPQLQPKPIHSVCHRFKLACQPFDADYSRREDERAILRGTRIVLLAHRDHNESHAGGDSLTDLPLGLL